jgi:UDP-glucose 4,6-dehydratase
MPLPIHGDGMAMRSYLHVSDVAAAFELILFKVVAGEVYSIGAQQERSVVSVARDIAAYFNKDLDPCIQHVNDRAFNDRRYFICDKKLLQIGWQETIDWSTGLKQTIEWYLGEGGTPVYWQNGEMDDALTAHPRMLKEDKGIQPDETANLQLRTPRKF